MKKFILCVVAIAAFALSCNKEESVSVSVTPSNAVISYKGGVLETLLACNTGWRATADTAYEYHESIVIAPDTTQGDRLVKITIPENDLYETRNIRIVFNAVNGSSKASAKFVVTQEPKLFVTCEPEYLMIGENGGGLRFDIISNDEWEFAGQALVEDGTISDFFPVSGKFNAAAGVTVSPNTTGEPRTIDIPIVISSDKEIKGFVSIFQTAEGVK